MARAGVTALDISQAASGLVDNGVNPTVERVRQILGTGSNGTIAPLLKQWKQAQQLQVTSDTQGLPKRLLEIVKALNDELQLLADEKVAQSKAIEKAAAAEAEQERALGHKLESALEQLEQDNTDLSAALQASEARCDTVIQSLEAANQRLDDKAAEIARIQLQNSGLQKNQEHFHESSRLQREKDLERYTKSQSEQAQQLVVLTQKAEALKTASAQDQVKIARLEQQLNSAQQSLIQAEKAAQESEAALTRVQQTTVTAQRNLEAALSENLALSHQVTQLQPKADKVASLTDQIALLQQQYHEVSQEKSRLQGECKQLEKMLNKRGK